MAGKKKKTLANKFAKMSDEDRARYLQHKAEIEEENRKRKEQLIATYMKKKIKKEDAFARLNLAKINQNWHHILRKIKVKEMKDNVEYLKIWIERILRLKNKRIERLILELEEAEEQYSNNFNSHSNHIHIIIEIQNENIENLQLKYQKELKDFLEEAKTEEFSFIQHSNSEQIYLKTVTYAQQVHVSNQIKEKNDFYNKKLFEIDYFNAAALKELRKSRKELQRIIWKQIFEVVKLSVEKTNLRRSHLQELRRIDAENAIEIAKNEETILKKQEITKILTIKLQDLKQSKTDKIKSLAAEEEILNNKFKKIRKQLKFYLELDQKQLQFLTVSSNENLDWLEKLSEKGRQLFCLSETCRKFETEREKLTKWIPIKFIIGTDGIMLTDDEKLMKQSLAEKCVDDIIKPVDEEIQFPSKNFIGTNFLDKCYESLEKLEKFWNMYNKVEVDIIELKYEQSSLKEENKKLKGLIQAVLEAMILGKDSTKSSTLTTIIRAQLPKNAASLNELY